MKAMLLCLGLLALQLGLALVFGAFGGSVVFWAARTLLRRRLVTDTTRLVQSWPEACGDGWRSGWVTMAKPTSLNAWRRFFAVCE